MSKVYFYPAHKYECHRWIGIEDICIDENGNRICFETEYAIKSGRMQQEGAVESVVIKLLTLRDCA